MAGEFDMEKTDAGDAHERGVLLVIFVLAISCAVHIGLMYACSDCAFAPMPKEAGKSDHGRKWTKDLPTMQVRKMAVDPLAQELQVAPRPAAAPDTEQQEQRVERLAASTESGVVPELPRAASAAPIADVHPTPARVDAAVAWQPRQEIAMVEMPTVPDEAAALPRIVIPKVERVSHAADITPSFDLLESASAQGNASGGGAGGGQGLSAPPSLASVADEAAGKPVPAAAPRPPMPGGVGGLSDAAGTPASLQALTAAEEEAAKKEADAAREAETQAAARRAEDLAKADRPVPPAPQTTQVNETIVEKEKEAVRVLRDETVVQGSPFEKHVSLGLGAWVDPADPRFKYFRILVSSHAEQPLPVVSKDIVFLLDASGSIANDRLKKCRRAVEKALWMLNTGDRFNVVAFRDKYSFAFPDKAWVDVTDRNLKTASDWLGTLTAHGQTDLFLSLKGVLAMPRDPARPVVAFVITDGDPTAGMTRNAAIISKFAELNGGLVSVFMYGVKDSANDYLMDMVTRGSRGTWAKNAKLRWNAADGIPELAKKFERPVLADIKVLFTASSRAETYPQLVSNLCSDEPIAIYGMCPVDQKEVVFTMRGLNGAKVYENLFTLDFATARKLDASVKTEWAQRRLYALIAAYTAKPDPKLMDEIRTFSARHAIAIPYEKEIRK